MTTKQASCVSVHLFLKTFSWPGTSCVNYAGLNLKILHASASQVSFSSREYAQRIFLKLHQAGLTEHLHVEECK